MTHSLQHYIEVNIVGLVDSVHSSLKDVIASFISDLISANCGSITIGLERIMKVGLT